MLNPLRLTSSAPAFFVPAFMTTTVVGVALAVIDANSRAPWLADGAEGLLLHAGLCLVVAAGIAGQIGLLEAFRRRERPGPEGFLDGIRRFTMTIFIAKLAITGMMAIWIHRHDPWSLYYDYEPYYLALRGGSVHAPTWLMLILPSLLFAPIVGTAARYRNPVRALFAALATTIRHPIRVGGIFVLQFALLAGALAILQENLYWREDPQIVRLAVLAHGPTLSFHMFPFVVFLEREAGALLCLILVPLSAIFTTAYWSLTADAPGTERAADPAPTA